VAWVVDAEATKPVIFSWPRPLQASFSAQCQGTEGISEHWPDTGDWVTGSTSGQ